MHRYIVWQENPDFRRGSVPDRLGAYSDVSIVRTQGPDQAVILTNPTTEEKIRDEHPDLTIELDIQHRLVSSR